MSALPGIILLFMYVYARPHEFFKELANVPFLYIFLVLALVGLAHDVSERRTLLMKSPMLPWAIAFNLWCTVTLAIRRPDLVTSNIVTILVGFILFALLGHGVQRIGSLMKVVGAIFILGMFVAYVGADQGLSNFECIMFNPAEKNGKGYTDGRICEMKEADGTPHDGTMDCIAGGKAGVPYQCERAGLFGTTSVGGGRVRYLGVLQDPNELALATALIVPFAFAFLEIEATVLRVALLLCTLLLVAVEIVFTGSRGGQVAFGAVLGAYFIKKYGWKRGVIAAGAMAAPLLAMGGRGGDDAEHSTLERLNCAAEGIKMLMMYPVTGVGYSQFTDHHFLTAHNAYILAAGELGLPGMFFFAFLLYLAIKIPINIMRLEMQDTPDTRRLKAISMAALAAFIGVEIGIFFLSWTYHYVLWIHFGLVSSLYSVTKRMYPTFNCDLTKQEAKRLMAGYIGFLVFWTAYIKYKGAWEF